MIYDAVETCATIAGTNFETDMGVVCAAKSVTAPTGWQVIAWQDAQNALDLGSPKPFLGVTIGGQAATQAKSQGKRDSLSAVLFHGYVENADPTVLAKQIALVPEAVMMTVDRLVAGVGGGVYGGAVTQLSATIEFGGTYEPRGDQPNYFQDVKVIVPVWDQDIGL